MCSRHEQLPHVIGIGLQWARLLFQDKLLTDDFVPGCRVSWVCRVSVTVSVSRMIHRTAMTWLCRNRHKALPAGQRDL